MDRVNAELGGKNSSARIDFDALRHGIESGLSKKEIKRAEFVTGIVNEGLDLLKYAGDLPSLYFAQSLVVNNDRKFSAFLPEGVKGQSTLPTIAIEVSDFPLNVLTHEGYVHTTVHAALQETHRFVDYSNGKRGLDYSNPYLDDQIRAFIELHSDSVMAKFQEYTQYY